MKMNWINKGVMLVAIVSLSGLFIFAMSNENKNKFTHEGTAFYFPTEVDFADEGMPMEIPDVRERFDRELLVNANLHASTILIIKRANRAFKVIEPILEKNGIPNDPEKPFVTSGIRLGSPAMTTRGFGVAEATKVGQLIADVLDNPHDEANLAKVRAEVKKLTDAFPVYQA